MPDTSKSKVKDLLAHNVYVNGRRTSQFNFPLQQGKACAGKFRAGCLSDHQMAS